MRVTRAWGAVPAGVLVALALAACSGTTDVSGATEDFNKELEAEGLSVECPKEVSGGEGTMFDCTMKGKNGQSKIVQLKIVKSGGEEAVDYANKAEWDATRQELGGG